MSSEHPTVEEKLRALQWRTPSGAVLRASLQAALVERAAAAEKAPGVRARPRRALDFVPQLVRWPLAACWVASLVFWWLTPQATPPTALAAARSADTREVDPALQMARRESTRQLAHELLLALEHHEQRY